MKLIVHSKWRYAVKKYDTTKKVSDQNIQHIMEAVQLSASSFGLQPYKILNITDPELREELKALSWNQSQITDASHLFIFCNQLKVDKEDVTQLMQLKSTLNNIPFENLKGYVDFITGKLVEKSPIEIFHWTAKQTYIALANAINACAELKIDSTPIEGFEADKVNEKLNLSAKNLNACVMLAIGYRNVEDGAQHAVKTRKSIEDLFEEI